MSSPPDSTLPAPRLSVVRQERAWFVLCTSGELGRRPITRRLQGRPLVLFRDGDGRARALLDRCPHRNVPLSLGQVQAGQLACAYHGWRFDGDGRCRAIPGLCAPVESPVRDVPAHPVVEQDGFVWVWASPGAAPAVLPPRFPHLHEPGYTTVRRTFDVASTLHAALENTLDVPHTSFLHGGLFRTARKEHVIEVVVRRFGDRAEAEFLGEPRPSGLVGRLLAPGGGVATHVDRFLLPSIAQVEYRLGPRSHLVVTTAMTPVDELETRLFAVTTVRLPVPGFLVAPFLAPVAARIFRQDQVILEAQTRTLRAHGGEAFTSTELDVLGPQIWKLLRQAERNETVAPDELRHEHRIRMQV